MRFKELLYYLLLLLYIRMQHLFCTVVDVEVTSTNCVGIYVYVYVCCGGRTVCHV